GTLTPTLSLARPSGPAFGASNAGSDGRRRSQGKRGEGEAMRAERRGGTLPHLGCRVRRTLIHRHEFDRHGFDECEFHGASAPRRLTPSRRDQCAPLPSPHPSWPPISPSSATRRAPLTRPAPIGSTSTSWMGISCQTSPSGRTWLRR